MSSSGEFSQSVFSMCTFNPFGELLQVDYANNCARKGEPAVGVVTLDGVVLATQKRFKMKYAIGDSVEKVQQIGPTTGITFSGLFPDFRIVTKLFRKTVSEFELLHGGSWHMECLMQSLTASMQQLTQTTGVRPFGLFVLLAGWDDDEHGQLYFLDSAGSHTPYKACAAGRQMEERTLFLDKHFKKSMDAEDGVSLAVQALTGPKDLTPDQIEVAVVEDYGMYRIHEETIARYI
ncbi:hypothetical protein AWZ03_014320 [Drosophila navojoa]|uniref:Proteasome subunit beta n=1 Tax=Drosophila navojoa TaxID=7232 RepID=A0A484ARG2_DRONA|nr:proteasome subunit alpha type-2-like [Drosophila navojoa]TDG39257.1 hypothetical protein AWZ03_014320 [Drosophila navojoa]